MSPNPEQISAADRRAQASRLVAILLVAVALAGCGSSHSGGGTSSGTGAASATPTASTPAPAPPPTKYAVIANINPFGDSCAGADFLDVARELQSELRGAGFRAQIHPRSDYPTIDAGQWCVQVGGLLSSQAAAEALVNKLDQTSTTTGNFPAKVYPVGGSG